ncbi:MAG: hypothetical protein WBO37_03610 [Gammaproteobacteria bacterium]
MADQLIGNTGTGDRSATVVHPSGATGSLADAPAVVVASISTAVRIEGK